MSSLALRETLLGAIKGKDKSQRKAVHTSDFRAVVEHLGLPFGHPAVEDILVHCAIDGSGYVHYEGLEERLRAERQQANAEKQRQGTQARPLTTFAAAAAPPSTQLLWRPDDSHRQMIESERQAKLIQQHYQDIHQMFTMLELGELQEADMIKELQSLGLKVSTTLQKAIRGNTRADLSFAQFMRMLQKCELEAPAEDRPAGGSGSLPHYLTQTRYRRPQSQSSADRQKEKALHPRNVHLASSDGVRGVLSPDAKHVTRTTHTQAVLSSALGDNSVTVDYNSEQKILREQLFVTFRKLINNEISIPEFQSKLFTMGLEIPSEVQLELEHLKLSGSLNIRKCMLEFDRQFRQRSFAEQQAAEKELDRIRDIMRFALRSRGTMGIAQLAKVFRQYDRDGSHGLSFSEFCDALNEYGANLDEEEMRLLFNSFDANGDGEVSYKEFLKAEHGQLKGHRLRLVKQIFDQLNICGNDTIPIEILEECYQPTQHPDVLSRKISGEEAVRQFIGYFDFKNKNFITEPEFLDYYTYVSATLESDDDFERMMTTSWRFPEKPPQPRRVQMQTDAEMLAWHEEAHTDQSAFGRGIKKFPDKTFGGTFSVSTYGKEVDPPRQVNTKRTNSAGVSSAFQWNPSSRQRSPPSSPLPKPQISPEFQSPTVRRIRAAVPSVRPDQCPFGRDVPSTPSTPARESPGPSSRGPTPLKDLVGRTSPF